MVNSNPTSPWSSAPLLVHKPGPDKFRFTVELRSVNRFTIQHQFPMPNVEQETHSLPGSRCYATFDLSHGYWQLPLDKSSQSSQPFIRTDGIYSPTRVSYGSTNTMMYFQSTLASQLPSDLRCQIPYWLDNVLLYAESLDQLITAIRRFIAFCKEVNFKLHPANCII